MFLLVLLRFLPFFGGRTPVADATGISEPDALRDAHERVGQLRGFYVHAAAFVVMTMIAFFVNVATWLQGGNWWFYWPAIVWAGLLATHAIVVVGFGGFLGSSWEQRKVAEIVARDRHTHPQG